MKPLEKNMEALFGLSALSNLTADTRARVLTVMSGGAAAGGGAVNTTSFLSRFEGRLAATPPDVEPLVNEVAAIDPAITGGAKTDLKPIISLVAQLGVQMGLKESEREIDELTRSAQSTPVIEAAEKTTEAYTVVGRAYDVCLSQRQRGTGVYGQKLLADHKSGNPSRAFTALEAVRIDGTTKTEEATAQLNGFSFQYKPDADNAIKTVGQFFTLLTVWMWTHIAVGTAEVGSVGCKNEAGTKGSSGNLPGGKRVFVTPGCMVQYNIFLFPVIEHGLPALMWIHGEVMRRMVDLILTSRFNLCSALLFVLENNNAVIMLDKRPSTQSGKEASASGAASSSKAKEPAAQGSENELTKKLKEMEKKMNMTTKLLEDQKRKCARQENALDKNRKNFDIAYRNDRGSSSRRRSRSRSRERDGPSKGNVRS